MNYNPLFIYGPSGLGKTHLLYAITNEVKKKKRDAEIIYIKGEDFTNQLIEALARQKTAEFRNKYRSCDMLLIDDIQFIAGKVSTQEEFFHTFNALYEEHKQIILTSDRPPREIKTLEDRLKTRFEWGLLADIQPPDLELRIAIIKKKAEQVNVVIPDEVLGFLAENLRSNIRQIEGAIKKLGALAFISGREISMELARGCISELLGGEEPVSVTVDKTFIISKNLATQVRYIEGGSARHAPHTRDSPGAAHFDISYPKGHRNVVAEHRQDIRTRPYYRNVVVRGGRKAAAHRCGACDEHQRNDKRGLGRHIKTRRLSG